MSKGDLQVVKDKFKIVSAQLLKALDAVDVAWALIDKVQSFA